MDGREGMAVPRSASFYINRGFADSGFAPASGGGSVTSTGLPSAHGYQNYPNPNTSYHSNARDNPLGSTFQVPSPSPNFSPDVNAALTPHGSSSDLVKKKRGRPRKYKPDAANMSLGLSPMSSMTSHGSVTPSPKHRGRPPGTGWKQKLATLGEWMNSSAGHAFTPHLIQVRVGEDIAEKILSFAQQRPRALCVLSANGAVSVLTLRQPSGNAVTFEGHFDILCLSGSYLVGENDGPRSRTGGLSISVCGPDGHAIGGAIGGRLTASSPVQVVVCSFVYEGPKAKDEAEASLKGDGNLAMHAENSSTAAGIVPSQNRAQSSSASIWPPGPHPGQKNLHTGIDLTCG